MGLESLTNWYNRKSNKIHPAQLVFLSYMLAISVGSSLLMLPFATESGQIAYIDALFTATSAVCVTGLAVVDTGTYFTAFGQGIILLLIQLGGLGIMTFSVAIFRLIGRQVSFRERLALQDVFTHTPQEDVYRILKAIFVFTFLSELVGAVFLFFNWFPQYPFGQALYMAVFHSISAFCNAGFALFENSFMDYRTNPLINVVIGSLIVLGGIGFPVVYDLYHTYVDRQGQRRKLLAQTRIVLVTTAILIVGGMILFWILELNNALKGLTFGEQALVSLFQSITLRTAGFNTVDFGTLTDPTLAMMLFMMFFGASPGSSGGGVKTTTLALIGAFAWSRLLHQKRVNLFKKSVPADIMTKSVVLVIVSIGLIALFFFLLLVSASVAGAGTVGANDPFIVYLFETVSAFGTVGLSMGVTGKLTVLGKLLMVTMMLIGRVGVLTIAYVVVGPTATRGFEYAEENIMVG